MNSIRIKQLVVTIAVAILSVSTMICLGQQAGPRLLPFQGRLTDQNGAPVTNGMRVVLFKIFDVPTGGTPVWAGEVHRTSVNGGLVNVLLGTKTPFPEFNGLGGLFWDEQLYLEITVDINGDNQITPADPAMLPRQVLLPVVFAKDSAKLAGYDWSSILTSGNDPTAAKISADRLGGTINVVGGNVGIGTASPHAPLEIKAPIEGEVLRFGYSAASYHSILAGYHGSIPFLNYLAFNLENGLGGNSPIMTILGNGNVGIGTTGPSKPLTVEIPSGNDAIRWQNNGSGSFAGGQLGFTDSGNTVGRMGLYMAGTRYVDFRADGASYINGGNVGIGTDNPQAKLDVQAPDQATARIYSLGRTLNGSVLELRNDVYTGDPHIYYGSVGAINFADGNDYPGQLAYDPLAGMTFRSGLLPRMQILPSGNVGIGIAAPAFLLHVNGTAGKPGGGSWSVASDIRFKKNIRPLSGALDELMNLRGVTFEYKDPEKLHELPGERIGMVAQEVEKVFPDWVDTGPDGFKRLSYRGFEALTVEALRELRDEDNQKLGELKQENAAMQRELSDLRAQLIAQKDAKNQIEARLRAVEKLVVGLAKDSQSAVAVNQSVSGN